MSRTIHSNQEEIDEALALSLSYDCSIDDAVIARQLQQHEEDARAKSLIADEELAKEMQAMEGNPQISVSDDENYANLLQEQEYMANHLDLADNVNPITRQFQDLEVNGSASTSHHGESSSHQQRSQSLPPNVDIDPENMTYEELNELGESIGNVSKGLSKRRVSQIPIHKYGETSWFKKKKHVSEDTQCSICLLEFKKGDMLSTLPCDHIYHKECISLWLEENKICCVCNSEIEP